MIIKKKYQELCNLDLTDFHILKTKAMDLCDAQTSYYCYCGKLATGLHTDGCSKFQEKLQAKMFSLYKEGYLNKQI